MAVVESQLKFNSVQITINKYFLEMNNFTIEIYVVILHRSKIELSNTDLHTTFTRIIMLQIYDNTYVW